MWHGRARAKALSDFSKDGVVCIGGLFLFVCLFLPACVSVCGCQTPGIGVTRNYCNVDAGN